MVITAFGNATEREIKSSVPIVPKLMPRITRVAQFTNKLYYKKSRSKNQPRVKLPGKLEVAVGVVESRGVALGVVEPGVVELVVAASEVVEPGVAESGVGALGVVATGVAASGVAALEVEALGVAA